MKSDKLACEENPDRWFPEMPQGVTNKKQRQILALEVIEVLNACRQCPVMTECATLGADEDYGIWGGTLPAERMMNRGLFLESYTYSSPERTALNLWNVVMRAQLRLQMRRMR